MGYGCLCWEPRTDKRSHFKAWSKAEYIHACFVHCQECLLCSNVYHPGPFTFISPRSSPYFSTALVWANAVSRVGLRNKIGHIAHSHKRFKQVLVIEHPCNQIGTNTCYCLLIARQDGFQRCNSELDKRLWFSDLSSELVERKQNKKTTTECVILPEADGT